MCIKYKDSVFRNFVYNLDVIAITEAWMSDFDLCNLKDDFPEYYIDAKLRARGEKERRASGGIVVFIRKSLKRGIKLRENDSDYLHILECNKSHFNTQENMYIGSCYIPPKDSTVWARQSASHKKAIESISDTIQRLGGSWVLTGDFNARTGTHADYNDDSLDNIPNINTCIVPSLITTQRNNVDKMINAPGKNLLNMCKQTGLTILNGRKMGDIFGDLTCFQINGNSTVDYGIVSDTIYDRVLNFKVSQPTHLSDHANIRLEIHIPHKFPGDAKPKMTPIPNGFKWHDHHKQAFHRLMNHIATDRKVNEIESRQYSPNLSGVNDMCGAITQIYITGAEACSKRKQVKHSRRLWQNSNLEKLKKDILTLGHIIKKGHACHEQRMQYHAMKKIYNKEVKSHNKSAKSKILQQIEKLHVNDGKKFWRLVNELHRMKRTGNPIDPEVWVEYFTNLNKESDQTKRDSAKLLEKINELLRTNKTVEVLDKNITADEVKQSIRELKSNKAHGIDEIQNEMLKASSPALVRLLSKFFNLILNTEETPDNWLLGIISPIHKKGPADIPDNYRGITVSSNLSKLFTRIMNNRLVTYLIDCKIIHPSQIGFMKGSRTSDHIFVLKCIVESLKQKRRKLYACFIDLKKAFDTVWREAVLYKLLQIGCSDKFTRIIQSMYNNLQCAVKCENLRTPFFPSNIGTRQGCNLSPMLFNIFLNDLPVALDKACTQPAQFKGKNISCLLYADDIVLLSTSEKGLQKAMDVTHAFCTKWKLQVNCLKTKILVFNSRNNTMKLQFGNNTIYSCQTVTYLGVKLQQSGRFTAAVEDLASKANRAYFILRQRVFNKNIQIKSALALWDTYIRPILLYCSEVWYPFETLKKIKIAKPKILDLLTKPCLPLEKFNIKLCKHILGVHTKTSNIAAMSELGRLPLSVSCLSDSLAYFVRIISFASVNTHSLLTVMARNNNTTVSQYETSMASMYQECNWICPTLSIKPTETSVDKTKSPQEKWKHHIANTKKLCHKIITNIAQKVNMDDIKSQTRKLLFYKKVKKNHGFEPYLYLLQNKKHRKALTRLRTSSHFLPIEKGRHSNTKEQERFCKLCDDQAIGTEMHVLVHCRNITLSRWRREMLNSVYKYTNQLMYLPIEDQFIYMVMSHDKAVAEYIGKYTYELLEFHDTLPWSLKLRKQGKFISILNWV